MSHSDENIQTEPPQTQPSGSDRLRQLYSMPGHLVRRAKQKSTLTFAPIVKRFNLTSIQYVVLQAIAICPGVDQAELGEIVGLDTSSTGQIVARLEQRNLLARQTEGRRQLVSATPEGLSLLKVVEPAVWETQASITDPLTVREKQQLLRLLSKMVGIDNLYHQPAPRTRRRSTPTPAKTET